MCANARPFAITVRTDKEDDNLQNWPKLRKIRRCFRNSYWTFGYVKYLYLSAPKIVFHLRVNLFSEDCPQGPSTYQCTKLLITVQLGGGQWKLEDTQWKLRSWRTWNKTNTNYCTLEKRTRSRRRSKLFCLRIRAHLTMCANTRFCQQGSNRRWRWQCSKSTKTTEK